MATKEVAIKSDLINVSSNHFHIVHSIEKLEIENLSLDEQIQIIENVQQMLPKNFPTAAKMANVLQKNAKND